MYLDKIHQRIREAFQLNYVYRKDDLLMEINKLKTYPLSQINYALEQYITDKNMYVKDIIGREGNLINVGDYYMFQPIELNNKDLTYEERRYPIDYKRDRIQIKLPDKVKELFEDEKDKDDADESASDEEKEKKTKSKSKTSKKYDKESDNDAALGILELMKTQFTQMTTPTSPPETGKDNLKGSKDWYLSCGRTTQRLLNKGYSLELIKEFSAAHIIEALNYKSKLSLLNFIYQKNIVEDDLTEIFERSKNYFEQQQIENEERFFMLLLTDNNISTVFVFDNEQQNFIRALPSQISDITDELTRIMVKRDQVNDIVGFMTLFKGKFNIFKTKVMTGKRNSGSRCDQSGKSGVLKTLAQILDDPSVIKDPELKSLNVIQICSEQEFILRNYDKIRKDGKRWFLAPEEYALSKQINSAKLEK